MKNQTFDQAAKRRLAHEFLTRTHEMLQGFDLKLPNLAKFVDVEFTDHYYNSTLWANYRTKDNYEFQLETGILLHDVLDYVTAGWQIVDNTVKLFKIGPQKLCDILITKINNDYAIFDKLFIQVKNISMDICRYDQFHPKGVMKYTGNEVAEGATAVFTYKLIVVGEV